MMALRWLVGLLLAAAAAPGVAQTEAPLFPQAFLVEHHVEQTDADGGRFATEPVVDRYIGSSIISVRPDGNRLIVDLAHRRVTTVDMTAGTYSVLTFDQMVELQRRLRAADRAQVGLAPEERKSAESHDEGERVGEGFRFAELPLRDGIEPGTAKSATDDPLDQPGVRHIRVTQAGKAAGEQPAVDVWVDHGVRLGSAAVAALGRFESEVLSPHDSGKVPFSAYVAAARKQTGAFPIRTARPLSADSSGTVVDVATRLEPIRVLPEVEELGEVPQGYQRTVHPLEQMVAFAEEEAELNQRALRAVE
jgi:hypothetical protein